MENYAEILSKQIGANTVMDLLVALGTFIIVFIAMAILWKFLLSRVRFIAKKTKFKADDVVLDVLEGVGSLFYIAVALFAAIQSLTLAPIINIVIKAVFLVAVTFEVIKLAERVISFFIMRSMSKKGQVDYEDKKVAAVFSVFIKIILWSLGGLLILSNLGFDVTSLIAGLGIGGLAISLALQSILGDLFSSLSIAVDKPFEEGDFIVAGDHKGTVKHIGIKSTRIQALQGEEIVISNSELTTARVQNFRKLQKRRVVFNIGVTYSTPKEKLEKVPGIIKNCVESAEKTEFDRAHFSEFGDFSLNFEVVYFILSNDYVEYMDAQQTMNLAIVEGFEKEGIEIAFPTQTVFVEKG